MATAGGREELDRDMRGARHHATRRRAAPEPINAQYASCTEPANMSLEIPLVVEIEKHPVLYNYNLPEYNRKDTLDSAWAEVAANVNLTANLAGVKERMTEMGTGMFSETIRTILLKIVNECKDKWKNIRSSYVRSLRTVGGKPKKPYYLCTYLKFVTPFLKPAVTEDSIPLANYTEHTSEQEDSLNMPLMIKMEQDQESECEETSLDPLITTEKETDIPGDNQSNKIVRRRKRQFPGKTYTTLRNKPRRNQAFVPPRTENNALKYFLLSLLPELDTLDDDQLRLFKIKVMMLIDEIKTDDSKVRESLAGGRENAKLQKRLINLLLKNLEKNTEE